ncbi:MAG: PAS domain S-box protein [Acidobacteria bacterium]|nr:MAG: PAS domain S-box protein [Acidobacteriota bacterium]
MSSPLTRSSFGLLLGILLASVLFFYWAERRIDHAQRAAAAGHLEQEVCLLSRAFVIVDPKDLDSQVDRLSRDLPFRITITDEEGTVLADSAFSGEELRRLENHANRAEFIAAARGESGSRFRYSTSTGRWLLYAAAPLASGSGFIRLAIEQPADPWISPELRLPLLGLLTCLVALGLLLLIPSSARFSRSRKTLIAALDGIAAGNRVTGVPISADEEFGPLARATETASGAVSQRIAALESERDHLTTVLSSMTEAVLVTDSSGRILRVNAGFRDVFGVEKDPIGRRPLEVVRNTEVQAGIEAALNHRLAGEVETRVGEKILLARFSPIEATEGGSSGVVMVIHDITKLRRLESVRKDFISNVSHELKTPLTSIEGYSETLLDDGTLSSTHRSFLEKIHRNARLLSEVLDALFSLTELEKNAESLSRGRVSVGRLIAHLQTEFSPRFAEKGIELHVEAKLESDSITASEQHLKRVLANLLENALKYTEKGYVRVTARTTDRDVVFSISDTGVGIPPEHLARVFERFYRVAKDRSRDSGGAGIGLALVKHIVQLHGGKVWIESKVGQGTTVSFTVPRECGNTKLNSSATGEIGRQRVED